MWWYLSEAGLLYPPPLHPSTACILAPNGPRYSRAPVRGDTKGGRRSVTAQKLGHIVTRSCRTCHGALVLCCLAEHEAQREREQVEEGRQRYGEAMVCGSQGWKKRQKYLGGGKKKLYQRIYTVASTSLGRLQRDMNGHILSPLKSIHCTANKGRCNLIGWCARPAGELATRLLGLDLIFILAQHGLIYSIADRTAANLLCNHR